ncbi:MAG TPA: aldehyde ferredoxin oxidoreductase [Clostridia bacterium]|nr:aldehyde ferredoxin oxidoreductase [Clostridia bacterium]
MAVYGWAGKILRVNFSTGKISTEDSLAYRDYIGGNGFGYKIIWDEVPLDTHPFDEGSKVIIAVGPLTGSGAPCSGRTTITCLSSWSRGYSVVDAHLGGYLGHALKYAGYDAVILEGKASKPVYLKIDDARVTIEDAGHLWGKGTYEANRMLVQENGPEFCSAVIGPAGENLVNLSCLITSTGNSGGAGVGAILGSKKVKGLVVRGTGSVKIADPRGFKELCDYMLRELIGGNNNHNVPAVPQSWAEYSAVTGRNRWSGAPGRGWQKAYGGYIDMGEQPVGALDKIGYRTHKGYFDHGPIADKYMVKVGGCSSCPIRCYAQYEFDPLAEYDLPTKVSNTCVPIISQQNWYPEGIKDFVDEGDARIILCGSGARAMNDYGLWCNYGQLMRDFNYCYKQGILQEKLPKEEWNSIPWDLMKNGDPRWVWEIVRRISLKEGEIAKLGLGTYHLVQEWNLGKAYYDDPALQLITYNGYPKHHGPDEAWQVGLLYNLMYNRDCMTHHLVNFIHSGSPYELYKSIVEEEFGPGAVDKQKHYTPMNRSKAKLAKWAFVGTQFHNMATVCNWMWPMTLSPSKARGYKGDHELEAKFMTALTGEKWTRADVDKACERVANMLRVITAVSFQIHEKTDNLRKTHDQPTEWVFTKDPDLKPFEEGTDKMDRQDVEVALDMFYEEMGWDKKTGIPTRKTLEELGLKDMADALAQRKLLPA